MLSFVSSLENLEKLGNIETYFLLSKSTSHQEILVCVKRKDEMLTRRKFSQIINTYSHVKTDVEFESLFTNVEFCIEGLLVVNGDKPLLIYWQFKKKDSIYKSITSFNKCLKLTKTCLKCSFLLENLIFSFIHERIKTKFFA